MTSWSRGMGFSSERMGRCLPAQARRNELGTAAHAKASVKPLKLLTFNIQTGITTRRFRHYVTKGWKHVLPHEARVHNLRRIADLVAGYDFVGLQEVDAGSLRSGFVNQVEYLAELGQFPFWFTQTNRDLGVIAQHGNGLLSRLEPEQVQDHKLPGRIPGRGAIVVRLPYAGRTLVVVLLHLSLGPRSRRQQLQYVADCVRDEELVVIMGDMNCHAQDLLRDSPLAELNLHGAAGGLSFPAWEPTLALDHILVSAPLSTWGARVLDCQVSDHLPIELTLSLGQEYAAA